MSNINSNIQSKNCTNSEVQSKNSLINDDNRSITKIFKKVKPFDFTKKYMKSKDENYSFLDISEVFCYKIKQKYNFINKNCEDSLKIMDNYLFLNKENKYFFSKILLVKKYRENKNINYYLKNIEQLFIDENFKYIDISNDDKHIKIYIIKYSEILPLIKYCIMQNDEKYLNHILNTYN